MKMFGYISPFYMIVVGISISAFSLITKRTFDPYVLFAFVAMAIFEFFFRKQKKISSNLLSLICALVLTLGIKLFVFDFKVMHSDIPELNIKKSQRVFYQPLMFKLHKGDLVIYRSKGDNKNYIAVLQEKKNDLNKIYLPHKKESVEVTNNEIKGKILFLNSTN